MDFLVPEPFAVTHWTRPVIGETPAGQVKYGDPIPRTRRVRGFVPAGGTEGRSGSVSTRVDTELVMLDDEGDWPEDSAVDLPDGRKFEVNGPVADYNLGPYGFKPGFGIELKRVNYGPS